MQVTEQRRRNAFDAWLRTGRWPTARTADGIELKFNPNHDPDTGRFTSADGDQRWGDGGFTGGGGGSFGGAGASGGGWADKPKPSSRAAAKHPPTPSPAAATAEQTESGEPLRHIVRNGYSYDVDSKDRTRRVTGELTMGDGGRSRVAQARAGGADRLSTDDGGHYIAARFNGPKEAFNHFAQDRSVNRGRYRRLEDQWARAKRAGHRVSVKIVPSYERSSRRPRMINVWFSIDGNRQSDQFPNSATGGKHAK